MILVSPGTRHRSEEAGQRRWLPLPASGWASGWAWVQVVQVVPAQVQEWVPAMGHQKVAGVAAAL
jgi:hypothetical protein